jgi:hypothetical protein
VGAGDTSADLDSTAIVLSAGAITDAAANTATIALPATTIATGSAIVVNGAVSVQITGSTLASDNSYVDVTFSEGVFSTNGGAGALTITDFTRAFNQNGGTATDVTISNLTDTGGGALAGGESTIRVHLSVTGIPSGAESIEIQPADSNSIYNTVGVAVAASESTGTFTLFDQSLPSIATSTLSAYNSYIDVQFSEGVYNTSGGSGAVQSSDFGIIFIQNGGAATAAVISNVTKTNGTALAGGETAVRIVLAITGQPDGVETIEITPMDGSSVFDASGNAMLATQTTGVITLNPYTVPLAEGKVIIRNNIVNPSKGTHTTLNFRLTKSEKVNITVYDLAGRPVAELYDRVGSPGLNEVIWNGKNRRGQKVVPGVYYVVVRIGKERYVKKVLVVK